MTKTKRIFSSIAALIMIFATLVVMCVPASAQTRSNGTKSVTITVSTKAVWWYPGASSITLSQTKGVCERTTIFNKTKQSKLYGEWDVVAQATDGSHKVTKNFNGSSIKISLKANKTYKITVSWDSTANFLNTVSKGSFVTYPTWKVKSTHKVSSFY